MDKLVRILRALALTGIVALTASSWSFQEDKPQGSRFYQEQSQDRVAQQQAMTGKLGIVGSVPESTGEKGATGSLSSGEAGSSFSNADAGKGAKELAAASKMAQEARNQRSPFGLIALIAGVLIGLGLLAKNYLDKNVPVPPAALRH